MARGRKPKTSLEELRSRWWYWAVARAVACTNNLKSLTSYRLGKVLKERGVWLTKESRQWYYYEKGARRPSEAVLNAVENFYPGTQRVFDYGPDWSYLWEALSGDPRKALMQTEDEWRNGVEVEHVVRLPKSRMVNESGKLVEVPEHEGVQFLVVPQALARRWGLTYGARLNLAEKRQPWERLQDLCGQRIEQWDQIQRHAASVLLSGAPSATATVEERSKAYSDIKLPYLAGLAYQIAQARRDGREELDLPEWDSLRVTFDVGKSWNDQSLDVRAAINEEAKLWDEFSRVSGIVFRRHIFAVPSR